MKFYLINQDFKLLSEMEDAGVTGNLFPYNIFLPDFFTKIARDIDINKKIKYMVAIRPHVLSPEYLIKINKSFKEISKEDRLQINLVAGDINSEEQKMIRTLGPITNKSSTIERSNNLIEYIDLLSQISKKEKLDYYVSVNNDFTFEIASKYNNKMIIQYHQYIHNKYNIADKQVMIYWAPIIRKTQEELNAVKTTYSNAKNIEGLKFTYDTMFTMVNKLKDDGIKEIIFSTWNKEDIKESINFIKEYNYKEG